MSDFGHYPHACSIPWIDRMDAGNLEEKVRQLHNEVSAADHTESKYEGAIKRTAGSMSPVQGGRIYDIETGLFIN